MRIEFPWPPSDCHPNKNMSSYWSAKGQARKSYRETCYLETKLAQMKEWTPLPDAYIPIKVTFHPRRNGDIDNMLAACKGLFDGMCDALGINDKVLRPMILDVGEKDPKGKVVVEI